MKLRTQMLENYDPNEYGLECKDASKTQQNFKDDADINIIVKRMGLGILPPMTTAPPMTGDFTEITDYRGAIELVRQAGEAFSQLPAELRFKLNNDPGEFIHYAADPANRDEMRRLGLALPQPAPEAPKEAAKEDKAKSA